MPDFRTHPSIVERNDLRWFGRATTLRRWYGRLSCLAVLAAVLLLVGWTVWGDERVYWSAPVSSSHAMFQQDCQACHVQPGAPLMRLATLSNAHHSVRDSDCQGCHAQSSHDHSERMHKDNVTGCVQCHREHVERQQLADVSDQHCTQCHAQLAVTEGDRVFAEHVTSFATHPEFLPFQQVLDDKTLAARSPTGTSPIGVADGKWRDRTELRFNHAKHLVDVGVLTPPPAEGNSRTHSDRKVLACNDCHVPDAAGQYMQPINYEQHCAACHKLEFSSKLAVGGPLPHEAPEVVFGLLRDRFMKYAEDHPERVTVAPPEEPRLPNKRVEPTAQDKWSFVDEQMKDVQSGLFANVEQGCTYCHASTQHEPKTTGDIGFTITPPRIPERWFPQSRFDHARHREVSCTVCHDPQYAERSDEGHAKFGMHTQLTSELSRDILMPKLETCHACHGNQPTSSQRPGARAHCVDCHDYHAPHASGGDKLDAWLKDHR